MYCRKGKLFLLKKQLYYYINNMFLKVKKIERYNKKIQLKL
ncbi:hypothetical protein [Candidatus Karelsulcia muelleri]|nr:hypothetical protein [Candidatus Karelsulcia muelleri]